MRRHPRRSLGLALVTLLAGGALSGCQHTIQPLDTNFNRTKVQERGSSGDVKHLRYQFAEAKWDSNGIGDIARQHGMETVYYADLETLVLFLGFFRQETVHIYGQ